MSSVVFAHALLWTRPAVTDLFYLRPGIRGRHWGEESVETNIVLVHFVEDEIVVVAKAQRPEQLVVHGTVTIGCPHTSIKRPLMCTGKCYAASKRKRCWRWRTRKGIVHPCGRKTKILKRWNPPPGRINRFW